MSQQDFFELEQEGSELDELLRQIKEELQEPAEPEEFQPELPAEYADLVSQEPEETEKHNALPGVLKAALYVCLVLVASVILAIFAWKCADEVCALTAEDEAVVVSVAEGSRMGDIADILQSQI